MIAPAAALCAALVAAQAAAPSLSDAPLRVRLTSSPADPPEAVQLYTLADAPTTPGQAFGASLLTSTTGLVVLVGLTASPAMADVPATQFAFWSRLAAGLTLMSVGPSVGDLMNEDVGAFLAGAGGRTAMMAGGFAAVALASSSQDPTLLATSILVVTLGALIWTGWCAADLVRSLFAPERWVERQNEPARRVLPPPRRPLRF